MTCLFKIKGNMCVYVCPLQLFIVDMCCAIHSSNGTFINGEKLGETCLPAWACLLNFDLLLCYPREEQNTRLE